MNEQEQLLPGTEEAYNTVNAPDSKPPNLSTVLHVSEQFYSLQCEGLTTGVPAVFLRLKSCVLECVWCDTLEVWKKGDPYTLETLIDGWKEDGWYKKLKDGNAHLVLTGGDPLIQQKSLVELLKVVKGDDIFPHVEVETEGVLVPSVQLRYFIDQFNVSPKLANSGMPADRRVKPATISDHASDAISTFKFVVTKPEDVYELETTYVKPFGIHPSKVYLMPEGQTSEALAERYLWIAEVCKEKGYRLTTRMQVLIWGKTTGV